MKMLADKMEFKWKFLYVVDNFDVQFTVAQWNDSIMDFMNIY